MPDMVGPLRRAFRFGLAALLVAGCRTPSPTHVLDDAVVGTHLPFLADGHTTRDEALSELGPASASFEGGRVLTLRLVLRDGEASVEERVSAPWDERVATYPRRGTCSLVLVFDERAVLERHSLVALRTDA